MHCKILDLPVFEGSGRKGCELGPDALRDAGFLDALRRSGCRVSDLGAVSRGPIRAMRHPNPAVKALPAVAGWTGAIAQAAYDASADGLPIFLGGDHSMSGGTISGLARRAAAEGRPLFVLWLDAHPDVHTLDTTTSGNLHGVPLAYATGGPGFTGYFPDLAGRLDPTRIGMVGLRSVDPAEAAFLRDSGITLHDMAAIDRTGVGAPVRAFLDRVVAADGLLHVSLDADFLDPRVAPGVGTAVPGGVTLQEAHLVMETLRTSGRVTSLDLVELNPLLDEDGRTARVMADLAARMIDAAPRAAEPGRLGLRRSA